METGQADNGQIENGAIEIPQPTLAGIIDEYQHCAAKLAELDQVQARLAHLRAAILNALGVEPLSLSEKRSAAAKSRWHGVARAIKSIDVRSLPARGVTYRCRQAQTPRGHKSCGGWGYSDHDPSNRFRCTCACHR